MTEPNPLFRLASQAQTKERFGALRWQGSLQAYLERVAEQPALARNAWQRMLDMIELHGYRDGDDGLRTWKLFEDPLGGGRDGVFGLQSSLSDLVDMLRAGAMHLGPERRMLLLHGPVGSSKSTIARLLKRGLEDYTARDEGAIYTFSWDVDGEHVPSPMNQDPLLLLPKEARAAVEAQLAESWRGEYELRIEGDLDPVSRFYYDRLMERYDGDWSNVMNHVTVHRFVFQEAARVGIGTFQPKDEKNQDSTELTGDLNYRKIAEYGSDSDPRAFNFDGEFHVANRGMLEFVEVLKLDVAFLYDLLGATQEHVIKPKKFQQSSIDQVILGHTNEPEYRRLVSNELMEAFRDRTIRIDVPYNLAVDSEAQIYRRRYGKLGSPNRRLAPHSLRLAALWAVLTRLEEPSHQGLSLLQKARLYNGERVQGFEPEQVAELRAGAQREGLFGISPRYVQDRIALCLVKHPQMVGPRQVLESIRQGLLHHSLVAGPEDRGRYLELVSLVEGEYEETILREVRAALTSDEDAMDRLCARYLDSVRAHTTREPVQGVGGQSVEADEALMQSVEEKVGIGESRREDFRHELMNYIAMLHADGRTFDYRQNKRLAEALERKLFEDQKDQYHLTSLVSGVVDPDATAKIAVVRDRLVRRFGYDELSASAILQEVAGLFARDEAADGESEGKAA
ncbi:MAG: serine protein kinase [Planctomycetes bacterium]|nr:serine protein kinase [Planctomycetota bacterium]